MSPTHSGILVLTPDGYGFVRQAPQIPTPDDVLVMQSVVRRYQLHDGDRLMVSYHLPHRRGEIYRYVDRVLSINDQTV